MKQTESGASDKPSQRQFPWIVFICAFLGAGTGFALSFHRMGLDAFEFSPVSEVSEDEKGRVHVKGFYLASIRVFGVLVFDEKSPEVNLEESPELIDRWRRYCQLIAGGMAVTGFLVGAGLGLCVQRLTLRRT
jgi:hypothetical protein